MVRPKGGGPSHHGPPPKYATGGRVAQPSPPILQTKHKHTFKVYEICQFDQLIFEKIIKIVATRSHLSKLISTKFDFGWCYAPDPAGKAQTVPKPPS